MRRGIEAMAAHDFDDIPWIAAQSGNFRKPNAGMLIAAHKNYAPSTPLEKCWMIGDRPEDLSAAMAANVNFLTADIWRKRFLPGVHQIRGLARKQIEFLEGIDRNRQ